MDGEGALVGGHQPRQILGRFLSSAKLGVDVKRAKPCKYCDHPVAPNAKTCPQCGGKKPYPPEAEWGKSILGLFIIIAVVLAFVNRDPTNNTSSGRAEPNALSALSDAEVEAKLKSETTALFKLEEWLRNADAARQPGPSPSTQYEGKVEERTKVMARVKALEEELRLRQSKKQVEPDLTKAAYGEQVLAQVYSRHSTIHPYYRTPQLGGTGLQLVLPEVEWEALSGSDRDAIAHFMAAKSSLWEVIVGRISENGTDIYSDRRALTSRAWRSSK